MVPAGPRRAGRGLHRRQHVDHGFRVRRCGWPRRTSGRSSSAAAGGDPAFSVRRAGRPTSISTVGRRPGRAAARPTPVLRAGRTCPGSTCPTRWSGGRGTSRTCACPASSSGGWCARRRPAPGCCRPTALRASGGVTVVRDGSFLGVVGPDEAVVVRAAEALRTAARWDEHDTLPDEDELDKFLRAGPHETIRWSTTAPSRAEGPGGCARPTAGRSSRTRRWRRAAASPCGRRRPGRRVVAQPGRPAARRGRSPPRSGSTRPPCGCSTPRAPAATATTAPTTPRSTPCCWPAPCPARPVQVLWSRQDELSWAPFGSAMTADVAATLDADGRISSWTLRRVQPGPHRAARIRRRGARAAGGDDPRRAGRLPAAGRSRRSPAAPAALRNALPGYDLPARRRITGHRLLATPVRSSAMRALGAHLNVFAIESFMDEAAERGRARPAGLPARPPHRPARPAGAARPRPRPPAGDTPLPDGVGRGMGYARYKERGAYCAVVAEVEAEAEVRVRRLAVAVDVGRVVNPDGVRNQIEGGAVQSASWTLEERVRFDRRRVHERRLGDLPDPAVLAGARGRRRPSWTAAASVGRRRRGGPGPDGRRDRERRGRRDRRAGPRPSAAQRRRSWRPIR